LERSRRRFVATLTLAADYCPKRAEGFAFAALMSLLNLSSALSDNINSFVYEQAFHRHLDPLILVSAGSTAMILVLVPLAKRQGIQHARLLNPYRKNVKVVSITVASLLWALCVESHKSVSWPVGSLAGAAGFCRAVKRTRRRNRWLVG
jgi:hypothetical protein